MKKLLLASSFEKFADKLDTIPHPALSALNVVCIPTAAYGEEEWDWLPRDMAPVQKRAKTFREFNIAGQSPADVRQALQGADVIYVTGGNTYYLLEQAQKCDFKGALKEAMNTGATYFGTCAGAILAEKISMFIIRTYHFWSKMPIPGANLRRKGKPQPKRTCEMSRRTKPVYNVDLSKVCGEKRAVGRGSLLKIPSAAVLPLSSLEWEHSQITPENPIGGHFVDAIPALRAEEPCLATRHTHFPSA